MSTESSVQSLLRLETRNESCVEFKLCQTLQKCLIFKCQEFILELNTPQIYKL